MTFDAAIKDIESYNRTYYGTDWSIPTGSVKDIVESLQAEYAPTIEMTQGQFKTILDPEEGDSIMRLLGGGTEYFNYLFWEPLTEKQVVQAFLHPDTIKVIGEQNNEL